MSIVFLNGSSCIHNRVVPNSLQLRTILIMVSVVAVNIVWCDQALSIYLPPSISVFAIKCVSLAAASLSYSSHFPLSASLLYIFIFPPSLFISFSSLLLSWLALVWLYDSPHACGGAELSCIVASRLAQNWHFSCAQKTHGEASGVHQSCSLVPPPMHLAVRTHREQLPSTSHRNHIHFQ